MNVGVLALQGDFEKHIRILDLLGLNPVDVRYPHQLNSLEGLVIPGGESTTMTDLIQRTKFRRPILKFAQSHPILGTCAGLIMMAREVPDNRVKPLAILNIAVERNGYGRQVHSFTDKLPVDLGGDIRHVPATFIRAPKITDLADTVKILSTYRDEAVVVQEGRHVGLSFHPELDQVTLFHELTFMGIGKLMQLKKQDTHVT